MKIIKEGKLPETKIYREKCDRCGTIFEFERKEATFHDDQRDGAFLSISCPLCKTVVNIDARL